jgi:hypothetical protein
MPVMSYGVLSVSPVHDRHSGSIASVVSAIGVSLRWIAALRWCSSMSVRSLRQSNLIPLPTVARYPQACGLQAASSDRRPSTTLGIYGHLMDDIQDTAAGAMGRLIWGDKTGTDGN